MSDPTQGIAALAEAMLDGTVQALYGSLCVSATAVTAWLIVHSVGRL